MAGGVDLDLARLVAVDDEQRALVVVVWCQMPIGAVRAESDTPPRRTASRGLRRFDRGPCLRARILAVEARRQSSATMQVYDGANLWCPDHRRHGRAPRAPRLRREAVVVAQDAAESFPPRDRGGWTGILVGG